MTRGLNCHYINRKPTKKWIREEGRLKRVYHKAAVDAERSFADSNIRLISYEEIKQ